jgi:hypothetical protein
MDVEIKFDHSVFTQRAEAIIEYEKMAAKSSRKSTQDAVRRLVQSSYSAEDDEPCSATQYENDLYKLYCHRVLYDEYAFNHVHIPEEYILAFGKSAKCQTELGESLLAHKKNKYEYLEDHMHNLRKNEKLRYNISISEFRASISLELIIRCIQKMLDLQTIRNIYDTRYRSHLEKTTVHSELTSPSQTTHFSTAGAASYEKPKPSRFSCFGGCMSNIGLPCKK